MNVLMETFSKKKTCEHRECMYHLVTNFKKRYSGKIFYDHLWPAAYSWSPYWFEKHCKTGATRYLQKNHKKLWTRSQFNTLCKVDYVTNNLAESFNNWIKADKVLHLDDLMDSFRQRLMVKWNSRRKIGIKMEVKVLEHIVRQLKADSRNLEMEVVICSDAISEVWIRGGRGHRYVVNLNGRTCSCRAWQVSGKPCKHGIAAITSKHKENLEDYVHQYFL
jgi:predicted nucleic acid-binding Zn finger protein